MHIGRLMTFAMGVVGGGLLQLWVLIIILNVKNGSIEVAQLLGDGGLFFFSTSLAVGSAISLFDKRVPKIGSHYFNVTVIVCGGILFFAVTYYVSVLSDDGLKEDRPFAEYMLLQIGCSIAAVAYWFYMGICTGLFTKEE